MKKFIKKFIFAYTFWGPEIGLSSCLFKHAWHTYPAVSQFSYRVLGTARSMIGGLYQEVYRSFIKSSQESTVPADVTAHAVDTHAGGDYHTQYGGHDHGHTGISHDDPYPLPHYKNPHSSYGPPGYNRRMDNVMEMLKNLQPKNISRMRRDLRDSGKVRLVQLNPEDLRNMKSNFRTSEPLPKIEIIEARSVPKYDPNQIKRAHFEPTTIRIDADLEIVKSNEISLEDLSADHLHASSSAENEVYKSPSFPNYKLPKVEFSPEPHHEIHGPHPVYGVPSRKPSYKPHYGIPDHVNVKDLLPAHHHEYHVKPHPDEPEPPQWLTIPFENIILEKLGFHPPGVTPKNPSPLKCSQYYAIGLLWRTFEHYLAKL